MKSIKNLASVSLLAMALSSSPTMAATTTSTFTISLTIQSACSISSSAGTAVNLGTFQATSAGPARGQYNFNVNCSLATPYNIGLTPSNNNTVGVGTLASSTAPLVNTTKLTYSMYQLATYTTAWGNINGTNTVAGVGTAANTPETVYIEVLGNQFTGASPDIYTDTVTITVTY